MIDLLNSLKSAFHLEWENVNFDILMTLEYVDPRNKRLLEKEPSLTAISFFSMMLEYVINDDEMKHRELLDKFVYFAWGKYREKDIETLKYFHSILEVIPIIELEFKRDIEDKYSHLLNPITAFANTKGGLLVIGIDDETHKIIGVARRADYIEHLIKTWIEPSLSGLYYLYEIKVNNDKFVHLIEIALSSSLHAVKEDFKCSVEGEYKKRGFKMYTYWVRTGPSTRKMEPSELNRIANIKSNYGYNFKYRVKIFKSLNIFLSKILYEINQKIILIIG